MKTNFKFTPPRCLHYIILAAFSFIICDVSYSQLKVNSNGTTEFLNSIKGNQSGAVRISTGYGYVDVGPKNTTYCNFITDRPYFAFNKEIYFTGGIRTSSNFAVLLNGQSYYAIHAKASNNYVGINNGPNDPQYQLDVGGTIRGTNVTPSDQNLKKDIKDLPTTRIDGLYNIKAKTYKYKSLGNYSTTESTINKSKKSTDDDKEFIGLIAQDIREVYPELVFEDSLGILSLNYDGLIPVIIEALKTQNTEIQNLKTTLSKLTNKNKSADSDLGNIEITALLLQNAPNPFSENTTIEYYLSSSVQKAVLYIYNLQGKQIKSIDLIQRESGSIVINGSELMPGMYIYSLIADGTVIDTKQMILTDN